MHMILNVEIEEVIMSNRVICWDDELIVGDIFWNHKRRNSLGPILPNEFFHIVEHVKNVNFLWKFCAVNNWVKLVIWIDLFFSHNVRASIDQMYKESVELLS
jgi:hypothetical protein